MSIGDDEGTSSKDLMVACDFSEVPTPVAVVYPDEESDGFHAYCVTFDIIGAGETIEEALEDLENEITRYVEEATEHEHIGYIDPDVVTRRLREFHGEHPYCRPGKRDLAIETPDLSIEVMLQLLIDDGESQERAPNMDVQ